MSGGGGKPSCSTFVKLRIPSLSLMQVTSQQQEMAVLDRQLGHKKEELHLLQGSMVQARADLQEALRLGETEVTEKCNHIRVCLAVVFKSPEVLWIYCEIFSLVPPKMQI